MTKAAVSPTSASGSNNLLTSLYHLPLAMLTGAKQRLARPHPFPVVHDDDGPKALRRQIVENAAGEIAAIDPRQFRAEQAELETPVERHPWPRTAGSPLTSRGPRRRRSSAA